MKGRGNTNVIFFGVKREDLGSVVKLNWEGHRIKILIGLGFRWRCLSTDTLIVFKLRGLNMLI